MHLHKNACSCAFAQLCTHIQRERAREKEREREGGREGGMEREGGLE